MKLVDKILLNRPRFNYDIFIIKALIIFIIVIAPLLTFLGNLTFAINFSLNF